MDAERRFLAAVSTDSSFTGEPTLSTSHTKKGSCALEIKKKFISNGTRKKNYSIFLFLIKNIKHLIFYLYVNKKIVCN